MSLYTFDQLAGFLVPHNEAGTTDRTWKDLINEVPTAGGAPNNKGAKDKDGKETNIPTIEDPTWDKDKWENEELTISLPSIKELEAALAAKETEAAEDVPTCEENCIKKQIDSTEKCDILKRRMELFMQNSGCPLVNCSLVPKQTPSLDCPMKPPEPEPVQSGVCPNNTTSGSVGMSTRSGRYQLYKLR